MRPLADKRPHQPVHKHRFTSIGSRIGTLTVLGLSTVVGILYIVVAQGYTTESPLGPSTFPTILGVLLVVSSLAAAAVTVKTPDRQIPLGNVTQVSVAVLITVAYLLIWSITGWFYLATAVYQLSLYTYLQNKRSTPKTWVVNSLIAVVTTTLIYLFFGLLLGVRF